MEGRADKPAGARIWDWPLRLWHWAFAAVVCFSLYTGLAGDIALLEWHVRSGIAAVGLLAFRIGWSVWGGLYARFRNYRTTPRAVLNHFRRRNPPAPHTAPGIALVGLLLAAVFVQAGAGLFASDEIFTEGPLRQYVSTEFSRAATWVHNRLHWLIVTLAGVHVAAHFVYAAVLRNPTPLAMFTGRKDLDAPSTPNFWWRAAFTLAAALLVVAALR